VLGPVRHVDQEFGHETIVSQRVCR
jgi:hypothetical protein